MPKELDLTLEFEDEDQSYLEFELSDFEIEWQNNDQLYTNFQEEN